MLLICLSVTALNLIELRAESPDIIYVFSHKPLKKVNVSHLICIKNAKIVIFFNCTFFSILYAFSYFNTYKSFSI